MKSRNRFLNVVLKNDRLNVAIDVGVFVLCGMPDATALLHLAPPTLHPLSIGLYNVVPVTETMRSRVLPLSWTKCCIAGFFVLHCSGSAKRVP